jgi:DNA anti-recombination protein RmuC
MKQAELERLQIKKNDREGVVDMSVEQVEKELFTSESRRVDAAFRRLDSEMAEVKKSQEKFETKIEKALNDVRIDVEALRADMNTRFEKSEKSVDSRFTKLESNVDDRFAKLESSVDDRFDKLESSVDNRFDKVDCRFDKVNDRFDKSDGSFKTMITIYLLSMTGIVLAAFYAFAKVTE